MKDGEGLKDGMDEYEIIKEHHVRSDEIEKETINEIFESDVGQQAEACNIDVLWIVMIGNCMYVSGVEKDVFNNVDGMKDLLTYICLSSHT